RSAPDAIAAGYEAEQVSYAQLDARANYVARHLASLGVGPDSLVGICMETSIARLAALIGIWKAGGGYVPLDPALPRDRLGYMIGDAGVNVIVVDERSSKRLPKTAARLLTLDDAIPSEHAGPGSGTRPANVAYVLYTSGSTGEPKGVVVEHRH